jgi:hypothetical protein
VKTRLEKEELGPSRSDQPAEAGLKESNSKPEKQAAKKAEDPQHCFICYQDTPNVIIDPCKHCELCKKCMKDLIKKAATTSCPLCKIVACGNRSRLRPSECIKRSPIQTIGSSRPIASNRSKNLQSQHPGRERCWILSLRFMSFGHADSRGEK